MHWVLFFAAPNRALINCLYEWNIIQQKPLCNTLSMSFDFWSFVANSWFCWWGKEGSWPFTGRWTMCKPEKFHVFYCPWVSECFNINTWWMSSDVKMKLQRMTENRKNVWGNKETIFFLKGIKKEKKLDFTVRQNWWLFPRDIVLDIPLFPSLSFWTLWMSGYHADTPITIKAEPSIWPTAAFINIHEHPL